MESRTTIASGLAAVSAAALIGWAIKKRRDSDWEVALERVSRGVVVIRVNSVKAFDMNDAGFSYATGFVVDLELGLILTNRHVRQSAAHKQEFLSLSSHA